jgi:hypothetical protein
MKMAETLMCQVPPDEGLSGEGAAQVGGGREETSERSAATARARKSANHARRRPASMSVEGQLRHCRFHLRGCRGNSNEGVLVAPRRLGGRSSRLVKSPPRQAE